MFSPPDGATTVYTSCIQHSEFLFAFSVPRVSINSSLVLQTYSVLTNHNAVRFRSGFIVVDRRMLVCSSSSSSNSSRPWSGAISLEPVRPTRPTTLATSCGAGFPLVVGPPRPRSRFFRRRLHSSPVPASSLPLQSFSLFAVYKTDLQTYLTLRQRGLASTMDLLP